MRNYSVFGFRGLPPDKRATTGKIAAAFAQICPPGFGFLIRLLFFRQPSDNFRKPLEVDGIFVPQRSKHCLRLLFADDVDLGDLYAESEQTLQGSFSAVSKPNLASKYSLELAICSKRRLRKGTWEALAEIYTMHSVLQLSNLKD